MNRVEVLQTLIRENGMEYGVGAEIGVWSGTLLFSLLQSFPDLKMYGIDQWKFVPGIGKNKHENGYASYLGKQIDRICFNVFYNAYQYKSRVCLLKLDSITAAEVLQEQQFDFIFIDADHRESFVRADIAVWAPKLKENGILLGHDISFTSVRCAVDSMLPGWKEVGSDHVWMIKREDIKFC